MRWLVTGAGGMLGTDLVALLHERGADVTALTRDDLDLLDPGAERAVRGLAADVVVNCAAWTAVDAAEDHEAQAMAVNGYAVRTLARASGRRLVHISTDYVFDGTSPDPYPEDQPPAPDNAYGRTKLAGEHAALAHGGTVVRTAWLYGAHGACFPRTMLRLAAGERPVSVVDVQFGQPTWTRDLAAQLIRLVEAGRLGGVFHGTSAGRVSWHGFAKEIFTLAGADPARVGAIPTSGYPTPAARPASSVLGHGRWREAGVAPIGDWREALHKAWPLIEAAPRKS